VVGGKRIGIYWTTPMEKFLRERCPDLDHYEIEAQFGLEKESFGDLQFLVDFEVNIMPELEKRQELLEELFDREWYHTRHSGKCLSWNIKVYGAQLSDLPEKLMKEYDLDPRFNDRWEETCEENPELFWDLCECALNFVGDKKYRWGDWYAGDEELDKCDYTLWQAGRSGGHLILTEFDNSCIEGKDSLRAASSEWLSKLLTFCESLDEFDPDDALMYEAASYRKRMEDIWSKEKEEEKDC